VVGSELRIVCIESSSRSSSKTVELALVGDRVSCSSTVVVALLGDRVSMGDIVSPSTVRSISVGLRLVGGRLETGVVEPTSSLPGAGPGAGAVVDAGDGVDGGAIGVESVPKRASLLEDLLVLMVDLDFDLLCFAQQEQELLLAG
jgi:hypothetical protein